MSYCKSQETKEIESSRLQKLRERESQRVEMKYLGVVEVARGGGVERNRPRKHGVELSDMGGAI
jgi:hypothetical protein